VQSVVNMLVKQEQMVQVLIAGPPVNHVLVSREQNVQVPASGIVESRTDEDYA